MEVGFHPRNPPFTFLRKDVEILRRPYLSVPSHWSISMYLRRLYFYMPKRKGEQNTQIFILTIACQKNPLAVCLYVSVWFSFVFNSGPKIAFSGKLDLALIFPPRLEFGECVLLSHRSYLSCVTTSLETPLQSAWNFLQDHPEAAAGAEYHSGCLFTWECELKEVDSTCFLLSAKNLIPMEWFDV